MRAAIACVWLLGCGRIAFDPRNDSGSSSIIDGELADTLTACTPFDVTLDLPGPPTVTGAPAVVWTGSEYLFVIRRGGMWSTLKVNRAGVASAGLDNVVPANEGLNNAQPAVAWSGSRLGLLSTDGINVYFRTFDPSSESVSPPTTVNVTTGIASQGLTWAGDRYLAAWSSGVNVYMREVSATGALLTGELLESTTGGAIGSVTTSTSRYIACVSQNSTAAGGVVVDRGTQQPQTATYDPGSGGACMIVRRSNDSFAATWGQSVTAKLQLIAADGTATGAGVALPVGNANISLEAIGDGSLRLITATLTTDHRIDERLLDANGFVAAGPTMIATQSASTWGLHSAVTTDDNAHLLVFPFDLGTDPYHLRLIQRCPN